MPSVVIIELRYIFVELRYIFLELRYIFLELRYVFVESRYIFVELRYVFVIIELRYIFVNGSGLMIGALELHHTVTLLCLVESFTLKYWNYNHTIDICRLKIEKRTSMHVGGVIHSAVVNKLFQSDKPFIPPIHVCK